MPPHSSLTSVHFHVISYGENHYKCSVPDISIHAEHHAVNKLPILPRGRRLKKIDLLVIRANKGGSIGNSKPCLHCILLLAHKLPEKGYFLSKVYYSNEKGEICATTLTTLLHDETPHVSKYYRDRQKCVK